MVQPLSHPEKEFKAPDDDRHLDKDMKIDMKQ